MVQNAMADVFGIPISLGTVNKLKQEASNALEGIVEEAKIYVQNSRVVGADVHLRCVQNPLRSR